MGDKFKQIEYLNSEVDYSNISCDCAAEEEIKDGWFHAG